jgi:ADP-ribosylglycohydrolase
VQKRETTLDFAQVIRLGRGVSGYMYHTIPVVIHAWLSQPTDFRTAIQTVIQCGGDTDTTAAILGGILGAGQGIEGIPDDWLAGLCEWPRTRRWMEQLGACLAAKLAGESVDRMPRVFFLSQWLRNLFFFLIVLAHVARRALPPY